MPTAEQLQAASDLFDAKEWPRTKGNQDHPLFRDFLGMLDDLDDAGRELLLELSKDFFRHDFDHYDTSLEDLADDFAKRIPDGSTVIVLPCVNPKDAGNAKSPGAVLYPFMVKLKNVGVNRGWQVFGYDRSDGVKAKHAKRKNAYIILVDDFIGTGETAKAAWQEFVDNHVVNSDQIHVGCLVALQRGIDALNDETISCIAVHVRQRGITDSTILPDPLAAHALMDRIEQGLDVRMPYLRGYLGSEALVMMVRCPDNTFPVYWQSLDANGRVRAHPFKRPA